jgi:hypothetical protein
MTIQRRLCIVFILICTFSPSVFSKNHRLHTEFGLVKAAYNNVRIPGDEGTTFDMQKSFRDASQYFRLDFKKSLDNRRGIRLLYAPLKLIGERKYKEDIQFNGAVFNKDVETKTLYQFNSYRLSYFYHLINKENWKLNAGLTGKIRDANIQLTQGSTKKNRADLGFVPLLHLWSEYWLSKEAKLTLDFDGLAAPQGRAFDFALMAGQRLSSSVIANLGYRMLDGGVDNDKVYNFSQFNFYFAALEISF